MKLFAVLLVLAGSAVAQAPASSSSLQGLLAPIREKYRLPALGGAIVLEGGGVDVAVTGVRKAGADVNATDEDDWHLGSDTKAMTATVIARLVERGKLSWESTIGETLPAESAGSPEPFRRITLLQLLSHQAGLPANLDWNEISSRGGSLQEQRRRAVQQAGQAKLLSTPGTQFSYSNLGYVIAGAMAEHAAGRSWEELMQELVFTPLGMHCGFGGTGTAGKIDQPWPHISGDHPAPNNGPDEDNRPVLGPAGTVHCPLRSWASFVRDQMAGENGNGKLLKPETYRFLHAPHFGGNYALGWGAVDRDWGGGRVLTHAGSNTMNFAVVWMAPLRHFAVLVVTNDGEQSAAKACDEAASAMILQRPH
ncbi:MAG: beta-lactamase family protein [Acidobacteria bacterium]|nr:beta-lactamase family protein [Acidobacteriota bacterium]